MPLSPYASLRIPDFRRLLVANGTLTLAREAQIVVVGWQVFQLTHDPLSLGLIGLAEALPFIAVALPAGYLADRQDRRTISVASLFVLACCSAALLAFSLSTGLLARVGVGPIYATIFVSGIARGILQPARQALSAEIIPRSVYQNAIAWRSSTWQTASVIGPAIGGLLYGFAGAVTSYGVAMVLLLVALVAFLMVRYEAAPRSLESTSMFAELLSGL